MADSDIEPGLGLSDASGGLASLSRGASFFMTATGAKQGKFAGSSTTKGQEGKIEVLGIEAKVKSPRDAASGLPSGRRRHYAVHVAFKLDKSTPLWVTAIVTNENLKTVEIDYWGGISKTSGIGGGTGYKQIYKVEMTNAQLADVLQFTGVNGEACVAIALTYQKIEYTWMDGNINSKGNWRSDAT
jgi:type VI secretion system secreted protein Hcp